MENWWLIALAVLFAVGGLWGPVEGLVEDWRLRRIPVNLCVLCRKWAEPWDSDFVDAETARRLRGSEPPSEWAITDETGGKRWRAHSECRALKAVTPGTATPVATCVKCRQHITQVEMTPGVGAEADDRAETWRCAWQCYLCKHWLCGDCVGLNLMAITPPQPRDRIPHFGCGAFWPSGAVSPDGLPRN